MCTDHSRTAARTGYCHQVLAMAFSKSLLGSSSVNPHSEWMIITIALLGQGTWQAQILKWSEPETGSKNALQAVDSVTNLSHTFQSRCGNDSCETLKFKSLLKAPCPVPRSCFESTLPTLVRHRFYCAEKLDLGAV